MNTYSSLVKWSSCATLLAVGVVILGAFTRLADAGLGCPDWPTCYGHFWVPNSAEEIHAANQAFAETPVETDKTWPEQAHRIMASTLGLVVLVMFALAFKQHSLRRAYRSVAVLLAALVLGTVARVVYGQGLEPYLLALMLVYFLNIYRVSLVPQRSALIANNDATLPIKLPAFIAGFVILQGLFGMWTVTLKLWPQVVTTHLLGGFATLTLLWLLVQRSSEQHWQVSANAVNRIKNIRTLGVVTCGIVIVQIAIGGWVSSNYAALACPDFPLCQNALIPPVDFSQGFNILQHVGPNYLGGLLENHARTAIHFTHRIGAIVVLIAVSLLALALWRTGESQPRRWALGVLAVLVIQILLGISNIVFSLPLAVAVAHNAVGALLLMVIVTINHRIMTLPSEVSSR